MRRPTFLRVYSSDATEKADEATPINRSDSDDVRNSIDNNELHLYTELHNDEQMLDGLVGISRGCSGPFQSRAFP